MWYFPGPAPVESWVTGPKALRAGAAPGHDASRGELTHCVQAFHPGSQEYPSRVRQSPELAHERAHSGPSFGVSTHVEPTGHDAKPHTVVQ